MNYASLTQECKEEARRSKRCRQQPLQYAEEQAVDQLQARELLDLRRAAAASVEDESASDEDAASEEESPPSINSSDEEEEEEKKEPPSQWTAEVKDMHAPPFIFPSGKQHAARHAESPLQFLQLFLDDDLMQQIVDYTNAYAHQHGAEREWRTTVVELYAFIGVHIYMAICTLPQWHMYWSDLYQQPFVSSVFSQHRFEQLLRYFYVADPAAAGHAHDPMWRVRPLIHSLQLSFAHNYLPSRDIALDEAMVAYKGRSPIKQYIPSKPHKWGYKILCLCSDDYMFHFEVHEGKDLHPSEHGATYDTVMKLMHNYQHGNHILYIDSYFTSPALLTALKEKDILACGSVRSNRKGMPAIPKAELGALEQGKWLHRQNGELNLLVWRDRKDVWLLYNHTSPLAVAELSRWNDAGEKVDIQCPQSVHDYFYRARSVDISNQLHYSYPIGRKSKKCWPRLAWWLIDMCIVNAFKLWSIGKAAPKQLDFREHLMHALVKLFGTDREAVQASRGANASVALVKDHFLVHAEVERECAQCSHRPAKRVESRYKCSKCGVHLCVDKCFPAYHAGL